MGEYRNAVETTPGTGMEFQSSDKKKLLSMPFYLHKRQELPEPKPGQPEYELFKQLTGKTWDHFAGLEFDDEEKITEFNYENYINQELQRRNRETRDSSRHERDNSSGGGSRVRGSLNRDMTPNKMGKQNLLATNTSLTSSDTNIGSVNKNPSKGRNIQTPQTSG